MKGKNKHSKNKYSSEAKLPFNLKGHKRDETSTRNSKSRDQKCKIEIHKIHTINKQESETVTEMKRNCEEYESINGDADILSKIKIEPNTSNSNILKGKIIKKEDNILPCIKLEFKQININPLSYPQPTAPPNIPKYSELELSAKNTLQGQLFNPQSTLNKKKLERNFTYTEQIPNIILDEKGLLHQDRIPDTQKRIEYINLNLEGLEENRINEDFATTSMWYKSSQELRKSIRKYFPFHKYRIENIRGDIYKCMSHSNCTFKIAYTPNMKVTSQLRHVCPKIPKNIRKLFVINRKLSNFTHTCHKIVDILKLPRKLISWVVVNAPKKCRKRGDKRIYREFIDTMNRWLEKEKEGLSRIIDKTKLTPENKELLLFICNKEENEQIFHVGTIQKYLNTVIKKQIRREKYLRQLGSVVDESQYIDYLDEYSLLLKSLECMEENSQTELQELKHIMFPSQFIDEDDEMLLRSLYNKHTN